MLTRKEINTMTLAMAEMHTCFTIYKINGKDAMRSRLANLGFVEGVDIWVVNENNSDLIVHVKDTRIALDQSLANRIVVQRKEKDT